MKRFLVTAVLVFALTGIGFSQKGRTVVALGESRLKVVGGELTTSQTYELDSRLLKRKVWLTVSLPTAYFEKDATGRIFPTVYLLHGLTGHFDNWSSRADLVAMASDVNQIIVTPEGGDGWYTDSATIPNDKFESYIVEELIPEIDHRFQTIRERRGRAIAGLSMGGYGAVKFGLKYPHLFRVVGSFSGALDAPLRGQDSAFLRPSIVSVFGADGSDVRTQNDIFRMIREAAPDAIKQLPFIYLSCGTEDSFLLINHNFDSLLVERKIPHEYHELPGGHDWAFWGSQIRQFLGVASKE